MQDDSNNKDPLLGNKIAGAILAALLLVFGLPQLTKAIFGGEGHHGAKGEELHLAYGGDVQIASEGGAAAEKEAPPDLGTLLAAANPKAGERRAALCKSCHNLDKGGPNSTGPNLWGVVGRPVASHPGFNYSNALKAFGGDWTYERLDKFLENSQELVPGTGMMQRFAKATQRAEILAYLATLSDDPVPFPAPAAPAATDDEDAGDAPAEGEAH